MFEWAIGLIILEVLWWLGVGFVIVKVRSLRKDIDEIPVEY